MPGIRDICLIGILVILSSANAFGSFEGDSPIDVFYLSRHAASGYAKNRVMTPDPSIRVDPVPMPGHHLLKRGKDIDMLARIMRIYFPRNYQQLVQERDLIVMFEAPCGMEGMSNAQFDPTWMSWLVDGVREEGLSLIMMGGDGCWGGGPEGTTVYRSWGETILDRILPFKSLGGTNPPRAAYNVPEFLDPGHPLNRLPWAEAGPVEVLNKVEPKPGANLIAQAVGRRSTYPWIASWRQGEGNVVGETQIFWSKGTSDIMFNEWEWYNDFVIYLMYFGVGKSLPDDLELVHMLRGKFTTYMIRISLLVSQLEFIEDFGVNTVPLYDDLEAIRQREDKAREYYRKGEYDSTLDTFTEIDDMWQELDSSALEAKDNALVWVYLIEWLVVTGVSLTSGVVLWMIMINRRIYREAGLTKWA